MHIIQERSPRDLKKIMRQINVDPYGIKIMLPKAINYLVRLDSMPNIAANILKQEMLSLGGEVAVSRDSLTGRSKKTDCLVIGNLSQIRNLNAKLSRQPFGLDKTIKEIVNILDNYGKNDFLLDLGRYKIKLGPHARIMGIMNFTPDSFSGDGLYRERQLSLQEALGLAERLVKDGSDIIDIGGESSRPGSKPISAKEEIRRVIPFIRQIAKRVRVPLSIDTYKPEVAKAALDNGASIVNDITGLRNPKMAKIISSYNAAVIIMHMRGNPRHMQDNPRYTDLINEILSFLSKAIVMAQDAGIGKDKIIVDPGIGFGKSFEDNLKIINRLREFKRLGKPILIGPSRKSFIGRVLKNAPQERIFGTVSACLMSVENGANIVRVHDVKAVKESFKIKENIVKA